MKKYLIILAAAILSIVCSCSSDNLELSQLSNQQKVTNESSLLINKLKAHNDSLVYCKSLTTRGQKHKKGISRGRLWTIVAADMGAGIPTLVSCIDLASKITAVSGGTAGPGAAIAIVAATAFVAGGASYGAYLTTSGCSITKVPTQYLRLTQNNHVLKTKIDNVLQKTNFAIFDGKKIQIKNDSTYSCMGQLHNDILTDLFTPKASLSEPAQMKMPPTIKDPEFNPAGKPYISTGNLYSLPIFSDKDVENLCNKSIQIDMEPLNNRSNYQEMLENFNANGDITSQEKDILLLFYEGFNESVEKPEDINDLSNYYSQTIQKATNLTREEKQHLQICFEMAKYSFNFWYKKGITE